jgi:hypothetical protein
MRMKPNAKRISTIERKAAPQILGAVEECERRKATALEEWRQQNCGRIAWDLFVLLEGPKLENPANYAHEDGDSEEDKLFIDSQQAYFAMLDRVLKHGWDEEGDLNKSKMSAAEMAFAVCLEHLYWSYEDDDLLSTGIFNQSIALGIAPALYEGEMSYSEAVQRIDDHRGGPGWRQICGSNEAQGELDAGLEIPTITEIPPPGRAWVDPGNWPK